MISEGEFTRADGVSDEAPPTEPDPHEAPDRPTRAAAAMRLLISGESFGAALLLGALLLVLAVTHPDFYSTYNLQSIASDGAIFAVVGFSQLAVLAIGQLNLAVPAIAVSCGMLLAYLGNIAGLPVGVSVVVVLLLGAAMGALQGLPIAYFGLNPFIVTLGLASVYTGVMFLVAGTATFPTVNATLAQVGTMSLWSVPLLAWLAIGTAVVAALLFRLTVSGRELLATGASYRAALFSGIPVHRRVVFAHLLSGVLAAAAAVLAVANLAEADTSLGQAWLLPSFVAPVLGGTLLAGGRITIIGTLLGALLLALLQSALVVLGVNQYWYQVGLGAVLLLAVLAGQARLRYSMRRAV